MGVITSNTFKVRSGSGTISLDQSALATTNCEVSQIPAIKTSFDEQEDDSQAKKVLLNLGEFQVSIFDKLDNGNSLFDELSATAGNDITLNFSFTTNSSRSIDEDYIFRFRDVEYNWQRREITLTAQPVDTFTDTVADIFTNNAGDVETVVNYSSGNTTEDCMPASAYIDNVLTLFNSASTNINNSTHYQDNGQTDGVESYLIVDYLAASSTDLALDTLINLAVSEGSVIGSALGYNFFTGREDQTEKVTISQDDVKSINPKIGFRSYLTIRGSLDFGAESWWSVGELTGDSDGLSDSALQRLDFYFKDKYIDIATWDNPNTQYDQGSGNKSAGTLADVDVNGDHAKGEQTISVTAGAGSGTINAGDYLWFEVTTDNFRRNVFYIADSASGSEIVLETPLIDDLTNGSRIIIINSANTINELAESAASAYAKSYGADGANRIEIEVYGIDTIKPYESFELDSSFVSPLAATIYRASEAVYNFDTDTIKIRGYEIT